MPRLLHRLVTTQPGENLGQLKPKAAIIGRAVERSIEELCSFGCSAHRACVRSGGSPVPSRRSASTRFLKVPGYASVVAGIHCFRKPIMQRRSAGSSQSAPLQNELAFSAAASASRSSMVVQAGADFR